MVRGAEASWWRGGHLEARPRTEPAPEYPGGEQGEGGPGLEGSFLAGGAPLKAV